MVYGHYLPEENVDRFRTLLASLQKRYDFVSYSDAIERLNNGPIDRPMMAFSFDDGYESAGRAARVLEEFGATCCLFVLPSVVGNKSEADVADFFRAPASDIEPLLGWDELEDLQSRGHEIGSHTMTHVALADLTRDQLDAELHESKALITDRLGSCDHFAWPFGRLNCLPESGLDAIKQAGYVSCSSAVRGHHVEPLGNDLTHYVCRDHVEPMWPALHGEYFVHSSPIAPEQHS